MAWPEFLERFIPDFYKANGRLPTPDEVKQAEASFRAYLRRHGHIPADEQPLQKSYALSPRSAISSAKKKSRKIKSASSSKEAVAAIS